MIFNTNNGGILRVEQTAADDFVKVITERNGEYMRVDGIEPGNFVMLIDWYRYIKDNDIQNDFINPYGKNKEV